jgi:hypothetical protein
MNNREAIRNTVLPRGGGSYGIGSILIPTGAIVGHVNEKSGPGGRLNMHAVLSRCSSEKVLGFDCQ